MLMEVKNNFKYLIRIICCNLKSAFEYRKSFIIQTIFMMVNNCFFLIFWSVVFNINGKNINGIEMKDILYLWSIPTISYGMAYFFFGGIKELSTKIITGGLDIYLTQPKSVFLSVITSRSDFSAFGDFAYGLLLSIIVSENIIHFLEIMFYSVIACIIMISTLTIIMSLSTWLGDVKEIAEKYEHNFLINFSTYPEAIYGNITKFILYTIVPAGYIVHLPIKLLGNFTIKGLLILILATSIYVCIAILIFKKVLVKYESGNSMRMKG